MATKLDSDAEREFKEARRRAFWEAVRSFLDRRSNALLSWEEVKAKLRLGGPIHRGIQTVLLNQIIGSVGRYRDFDRAFLPRKDNLERRWNSIARAHYEGTNLPPVRLYQVGEAYFCVDGHHRISVARKKGHTSIDAHVTEVLSKVPVTADLDADNLEIRGEHTLFLERTHLDTLRPEQDIRLTIGGGYHDLLEQIAIHRVFAMLKSNRLIPEDEAVCDWYDNLYQPLVHAVHSRDILRDFPGRTEADLYLWIVEHQHHLQEACGLELSQETALESFSERHSGGLTRRALKAAQELISGPDCPQNLSDRE